MLESCLEDLITHYNQIGYGYQLDIMEEPRQLSFLPMPFQDLKVKNLH